MSFSDSVPVTCAVSPSRWRFDFEIATDYMPANQFICRGVAHWRDASAPENAHCSARIFMGTADSRLIAVDARRGTPV